MDEQLGTVGMAQGDWGNNPILLLVFIDGIDCIYKGIQTDLEGIILSNGNFPN